MDTEETIGPLRIPKRVEVPDADASGMTIDGVAVQDLLSTYRTANLKGR